MSGSPGDLLQPYANKVENPYTASTLIGPSAQIGSSVRSASMLALSSSSSTASHNGYGLSHTPHISSPLSPRTRRSSFQSSISNLTLPPSACQISIALSPPPQTRPAAKPRLPNANPLLRRPLDSRDRRRGLFLKKVRKESEDRRWQARGGEDEVMRSIYLAERRRWELMQLRFANGAMGGVSEADAEEAQERQEQDPETTDGIDPSILTDAELEAEIARELSELEDWGDTFLQQSQADIPTPSFIEPYAAQPAGDPMDLSSQRPRSKSENDDDEYDRLFLEMVDEPSPTGQVWGLQQTRMQGCERGQVQEQRLPSEPEWAQMTEDVETMMDTSGA